MLYNGGCSSSSHTAVCRVTTRIYQHLTVAWVHGGERGESEGDREEDHDQRIMSFTVGESIEGERERYVT